MKQLLISLIIVSSLSWLAWSSWLSTQHKQSNHQNSRIMPDSMASYHGKWHILSRRIVWDHAIDAFKQRFKEENIHAQLMMHKEPVMLHVFDDPRRFHRYSEAEKAKKAWHIQDADILKRKDGSFMVGLGRFFVPAYAQKQQELLEATGQKYTYTQTSKVIPTYRFVLPAFDEKQAALLWQRIHNIGAIDPIMVSEHEFRIMYPDYKP